jgi:hypothetical protein
MAILSEQKCDGVVWLARVASYRPSAISRSPFAGQDLRSDNHTFFDSVVANLA